MLAVGWLKLESGANAYTQLLANSILCTPTAQHDMEEVRADSKNHSKLRTHYRRVKKNFCYLIVQSVSDAHSVVIIIAQSNSPP